MTGQISILGIAGSLREHSYNRGLIRAAQKCALNNAVITPFDLHDIPPYDADVEAKGDPLPVVRLKDAIRKADALLIATPEYNYGVPGVLKNALDWASRPAGSSVLMSKPIAIMGASTGRFGTVRAQLALRSVLLATQSLVLPSPEVLVTQAASKFDAQGNLTDKDTQQRVCHLVEALVAWTTKFKQ